MRVKEMKEDKIQYSKDLVRLLRQKDQGRISDAEYGEKLHKAQVRNGIIKEEIQVDPEYEERARKMQPKIIKDEKAKQALLNSQYYKDNMVCALTLHILNLALKEGIITEEENMIYKTEVKMKHRDKYRKGFWDD